MMKYGNGSQKVNTCTVVVLVVFGLAMMSLLVLLCMLLINGMGKTN